MPQSRLLENVRHSPTYGTPREKSPRPGAFRKLRPSGEGRGFGLYWSCELWSDGSRVAHHHTAAGHPLSALGVHGHPRAIAAARLKRGFHGRATLGARGGHGGGRHHHGLGSGVRRRGGTHGRRGSAVRATAKPIAHSIAAAAAHALGRDRRYGQQNRYFPHVGKSPDGAVPPELLQLPCLIIRSRQRKVGTLARNPCESAGCENLPHTL